MCKRTLSVFLALLLVWAPAAEGLAQAAPRLDEIVNQSYLQLLRNAANYRLSERQLEAFEKELERQEDAEKDRLADLQKAVKKQQEAAQEQLEKLNKMNGGSTEAARSNLHCTLLALETQLRKAKTEREHGVPVSFDNKLAKLQLLRQWPVRQKQIEQELASEQAGQRRWGNVKDIGFRVIAEGQEKDVKAGEEAVREMRASGMMPPVLEDREVNRYAQKLANLVAANSDLKVPVRLTVLDSKEINAFALPGGFLFINTGLMKAAENESELVGVIAHELAHDAARHGAKLKKRATIAGALFQGAQVAAAIFTGGVSSLAAYYALQYGFQGLGLALNLALLGVNRDYETEADQLGVQYTWKAGYDPLGFITFFDKMASKEGYVQAASFFRTHPPFLERIISTFSEVRYLPRAHGGKLNSLEFQNIKKRLTQLDKAIEQNKDRPTLRRGPQCPAPESE
jgi:Zn-dependent protease with chaperone function